MRGCVNRQITTFGMPTKIKFAAQVCHYGLSIARRIPLSRNRVSEAHFEVFLPTCQGIIRAAKGDEMQVFF